MRVRIAACAVLVACGGESGPNNGDDDPGPLPAPSCDANGGGTAVAAPVVKYTLADRWHEAWLASPAVADLNGDGVVELVVPRHEQLIVWHVDGMIAWRAVLPGRIWSSPVVADLDKARPGLEVAVSARGTIAAFDAAGQPLPG